ncbi:MAG: BglII/BstYI family type II restriction endonuclease [Candidatus Thorarchaeota archaeon]
MAQYSFKGGQEYLERHKPRELDEIRAVISSVNAASCKTKKSKEKGMVGRILYSPVELNKRFAALFFQRGWERRRIDVQTTVLETGRTHKGFREMDAVKNCVGIEVQFGKYAFMVYNVAAKMTIFANQGIIKAGVEIVPMWTMAQQMSSGVSHFEQMKTDLEMRGEADIDIPVLIIGIAEDQPSYRQNLLT